MKLDNIIGKTRSKIVYRDGDLAIKVFNEGYSKANVLREALNHSLIEEIGLNVPKVVEVCKVDNKWAIVYDFIEGESLDKLMAKNPEKIDEYLELFVDLQMHIHTKKSPVLIKLKDKMKGKISEANISESLRYDLHTRLEGMPKHTKVCHGDFNPANIIVTPDGKAYVLDWAHVTQGNASADVARSYLLFYLDGKAEIGEKYLDLFCKKTNTAKHYIQQWIPIVATSQSVKAYEDERELLLHWANVVDYE